MAVSVSSLASGSHFNYTAPPTREGREITPMSSMRDGKKPGRKPLRAKIIDSIGSPVQKHELKYMPKANSGEENGWQTKCEGVKSRVAMLFNCYTMSDVMFQVDVHTIPAHKFILASASPVWFKQLYEDEPGERLDFTMRSPMVSESGTGESWYNGGAGGLGGRHVMLEITEVSHLAFFEFLQFIYTDNVNITLENVLPLMLLADTYKVAGLSDRCMEYIRTEVVPTSVLRVIHIVRTLLVKACMSLWKAILQQGKAVRKFQELTLAERRAKMEEMDSSSVMSSRMGSRRASVSGNRSSAKSTMRSSHRSSRSSVRSSGRGFYGETDMGSLMGDGDFGDTGSALDVAQNYAKKAFKTIQSQGLEARLIWFCEEINRKCWKTVQEDTGMVISCQDMWDQDIRMVREILSLESLSVPEIALFRSIMDWAQRRCSKEGMRPTAENQRQVIGMDTVLLLRFPTMTPEQFEWEVVPTGLLEYEDTEQLLCSISKKSAMLGRFNGKPRTNINFAKESSGSVKGNSVSNLGAAVAQNLAYDESSKTLYNAAADDPVDSILGSKLLRGYLKSKVLCNYGDTMVTVSEAELVQQASSAARLPPIQMSPTTSPQHPSRSSRSSPFSSATEHSAASTPRGSVQLPPPSPNIMAQRLEKEHEGGGQAAAPEDFVRICPGLYVLRGTSLLELWLEDGEVVCKDHGPNERLEDPNLEDASPQEARRILGLPDGPPMGRGAVLDSFLAGH